MEPATQPEKVDTTAAGTAVTNTSAPTTTPTSVATNNENGKKEKKSTASSFFTWRRKKADDPPPTSTTNTTTGGSHIVTKNPELTKQTSNNDMDKKSKTLRLFTRDFWSSAKKEENNNTSNQPNNTLNKSPNKDNNKDLKESGSGDDNDEAALALKPAIIYASSVQELPEELIRKIKKARLDDEKLNQHFDVLSNVIRFVTKKTIIRDKQAQSEKKKEPKKDVSESNIPIDLLESAKATIFYQNPKKLFKKSEFTGKGGFGSVYFAKSIPDKNAKVAVKKMPHATPKEIRMNLDEVAVLNFCKHPNIVSYMRSYIFENEIAIVMEYLEGGSLSEAAKKYDFEEDHIAFIGREMLKAISYLHANKLVHRDLKSGNVMLSIKGDIKLIDFGLTVEISKCRVHMVGSPFWMPPEMIQSKPHGYPADIWSFAICLIEMRDKKPPNRKARIKAMFITATEGLQSHVTAQSQYTDEFKNFLNMCLEIEPSKRALPEALLQHAFIAKSAPQKKMESVLREIFLSNAFENSGFFI